MIFSKSRPPKIVIIGRPNVGKSTLFNRIIKKRKTVVEKKQSTTRDRVSEVIEWDGSFFELVDTGGMDFNRAEVLASLVEKQVISAIKEADRILFVCDVKTGLMPLDERICELLRKFNKKTIVVVNKVDNESMVQDALEFHKLGLGEVMAVSAEGGLGIADLLDIATDIEDEKKAFISLDETKKKIIKLAIVGKPNAGKSSFVNTVLGQERVIVSSEPGTTRDSIDTYFEKDRKRFVIIDTAGIRSKKKIKDNVTYFSILRTKESVKKSDVTIIVIDGMDGITKEDFKIIDTVQQSLKPFILAINKWDLCAKEGISMKDYEQNIRKGLNFIYKAPLLFTSAVTGKDILKALEVAYNLAERSKKNFSTSLLNEMLKSFVIKETRLYSISQIKNSLPEFEIIAKSPEAIGESTKNYITNKLRKNLGLEGIPIKLNFRKKRFK